MEKLSDSDMIIDGSAVSRWYEYIGNRSITEAFSEIITIHKSHTASINLVEVDGFDGGMFMTDIPNSDLAILEIRINQKTSLGLYSQNEAREVAIVIMNALGIQTDDTLIQ